MNWAHEKSTPEICRRCEAAHIVNMSDTAGAQRPDFRLDFIHYFILYSYKYLMCRTLHLGDYDVLFN